MQPVTSILRDLDPQCSMRSGLAALEVSCAAHILGIYAVGIFGLSMKRPWPRLQLQTCIGPFNLASSVLLPRFRNQ